MQDTPFDRMYKQVEALKARFYADGGMLLTAAFCQEPVTTALAGHLKLELQRKALGAAEAYHDAMVELRREYHKDAVPGLTMQQVQRFYDRVRSHA